MHSLRTQQTIAKAASVEGFGYWSGRDVRVEFRPAPADSGIVFVRDDLGSDYRIAARAEYRVEMPRRTTLVHKATTVEMVEHVLAALAGLQIDNCFVHVTAPEMPGMDGSAMPFVRVLQQAGIMPQESLRPKLIVKDVTRLGDEHAWVEARPFHEDCLRVQYRLDYGASSPIGRQRFDGMLDPEFFCRELAAARTYLLQHEAQWLLSQGLGTRVTAADVLVFDEQGPIDNRLHYPDECVRHKVLDLVGDLALAGCDLVGHITAHRSGHRLNAKLVRVLASEGELIYGLRRSA